MYKHSKGKDDQLEQGNLLLIREELEITSV